MNTLEQLNWRYATKKFDAEKKLTQEQVDTLLEAIRLTPTSYGLQPMKVVEVSDPALREQLLPAAFQQKQVVEASHLLVLCRMQKIEASFIESYVKNISATREEALDDVNLSAYKKTMMNILNWDLSTQQQWMKNQVYITLGNLLTVCAMEQIDACPMEGFDPIKVDEILSLKEKGLGSVLLCPVGYRSQSDIFSKKKKVRKPAEEFLIRL